MGICSKRFGTAAREKLHCRTPTHGNKALTVKAPAQVLISSVPMKHCCLVFPSDSNRMRTRTCLLSVSLCAICGVYNVRLYSFFLLILSKRSTLDIVATACLMLEHPWPLLHIVACTLFCIPRTLVKRGETLFNGQVPDCLICFVRRTSSPFIPWPTRSQTPIFRCLSLRTPPAALRFWACINRD